MEKETCCVCGEEAKAHRTLCENAYCDKHYKTTIMTGNCCAENEKDYNNSLK